MAINYRACEQGCHSFHLMASKVYRQNFRADTLAARPATRAAAANGEERRVQRHGQIR